MKTACYAVVIFSMTTGHINAQGVQVGNLAQPGYLEIIGLPDTPALQWDNGDASLNSSQDAIIWNRAKFRILVDADNNNGVASQFSLFSNTDIGDNDNASVNFNLDGGDSWIKSGNFGIGTTNPNTDLEILGPNDTRAIRWDSGGTSLRHHFDMLVTERKWMRVLIDSDNDDDNAHFALYNNKSASSGLAAVRFHLDGGDSWIGLGNFGLGTNTPSEKLDVVGAVKIGDTTNPNPGAGTMRWNPATADFEGFDGSLWLSLTGKSKTGVTMSCQNSMYIDTNFYCINSLACHDSLIAVGRPCAANAPDNSGQVTLIQNQFGCWSELASISYPSSDTISDFGHCVSMNEDYLVVGAPTSEHAGICQRGKVIVYEFNGTSWIFKQELSAPGAGAYARFGHVVEVNGAHIAVSSNPYGASTDPRQVFLYKLQGLSWVIDTVFESSSVPLAAYKNVSLDGLQIGIIDMMLNRVKIYQKILGEWTLTHIALGGPNTLLGNVELEGDIVTCGTLNATNETEVIVYEMQGPSTVPVQKLKPPDFDPYASYGDAFGFYLRLDNGVLYVGHPGLDLEGLSSVGAIQTYTLNTQRNFVHTATLRAVTSTNGSGVGQVFTTHANTVVSTKYFYPEGQVDYALLIF